MPKSSTYEEFVEKFKPKKTTDDCYTPPEVYEAVLRWVEANSRVAFDRSQVLRPFKPGGDYESEDYRGRVVVDNPPFSILSKIVNFYLGRGVKFFLFAPSLTLLSGRVKPGSVTYVANFCNITYENGAVVKTSFITNMMGGEFVVIDPALNDAVKDAQRTDTVRLPKYSYPRNLFYARTICAINGRAALRIGWDEVASPRLNRLDSQAGSGKAIFGGGYLLSTAAAERVEFLLSARERAAAAERVEFQLNERERAMIAACDERLKNASSLAGQE